MFSAANFTSLLASLRLAPALERPDIAGPVTVQAFVQTSSESNNACAFQPYPSPSVNIPQFAPYDPKISSIYRYRQQQSVNLGSWFVQENWMVPSIFTCAGGNKAGEHDVASGWGNTTVARQILERHWDTWIQPSDFAYLRSIGINTVRLPIGFWSLGPSFMQGTPFEDVAQVYMNSWPRVLQAIKTAELYGIGVLVDLHGAPGSQNGQSHSGTSDGVVGLFKNESYMNKTIDVLAYLTEQLTCVNNVVGIQILNEPVNDPILPSFYNRTLDVLRSVNNKSASFPFYIHDAFNLGQYSAFVANRDDFLVEDHHSYFVYTASDTTESAQGHTNDVNTTIAKQLTTASNSERGNLVLDEWSCALTDKSLAQASNPAAAQQEFCTTQMDVYAAASAGWAFWSYYMEDCQDNGGWCFKQAVNNSLPPTFFSYPTIASAPRDPLAPLGDAMSYTLANLSASAPISQIVQLALMPNDADHPTQGTSPFNRLDSITANQAAIARGYQDGFTTSKIFAQYGMSRLGFKGQYIADSAVELVQAQVIGDEDQSIYGTWFKRGLSDGEAQVIAAISNTVPVYSHS
ncbi:glycoside hydrolase [Clavulina sp. PMI_390]|nr:glycoside hydrolase [Clavulina sp. PMI_390]